MTESALDEPVADAGAAAGESVLDLLEETLGYARERSYTGWDYADGLSSAFVRHLPVDNTYLNLLFQELPKRAPVNLRPYLLVEQRRNYKGSALFALANSRAADLVDDSRTAGVSYRDEARDLLHWLLENRCSGHTGYCAGYQHVLQELDGKRYPGQGDIVATTYGVRALIEGADLVPNGPEVAQTATTFVEQDLHYRPATPGAKLDYHPNEGDRYDTLNAIALGAHLYLALYDHFGTDDYRRRAGDLLDYVVDNQADCGGWKYRSPASASHLSMDNHHNGFIVECLWRYHDTTGELRYDEALSSALRFYRETLFEPNGAPNWDEQSAYPRDIHAVAQGIIVFSLVGDTAFARRIIDWAVSNLYAGEGQFYYQRRRFYTKRFTLMRWCQAWMAYALATHATVA